VLGAGRPLCWVRAGLDRTWETQSAWLLGLSHRNRWWKNDGWVFGICAIVLARRSATSVKNAPSSPRAKLSMTRHCFNRTPSSVVVTGENHKRQTKT
jgi:hypothetical protein